MHRNDHNTNNEPNLGLEDIHDMIVKLQDQTKTLINKGSNNTTQIDDITFVDTNGNNRVNFNKQDDYYKVEDTFSYEYLSTLPPGFQERSVVMMGLGLLITGVTIITIINIINHYK